MNHLIMAMNQQQQLMNIAQSQSQAMMNNQPLMMNPRNFSLNSNNYGRIWNGKKMEPIRRKHNRIYGSGSGLGYKPQSQNRKSYLKKKNGDRYVPYAPRNTTSFIIRAKKFGGIADLVSPCLVTPSSLLTPTFSPSREVLCDMVKEEWGVDGYGTMEGLIRLSSDRENELEPYDHGDDDEDEEEGGSCVSDLEEHVEVERRLDHDLSQFEMVCSNYKYNNVLENRVDDQDSHIAQLQGDNLTFKERLFLMEREFGDFRKRLQSLERRNMVVGGDGNGEIIENEARRMKSTTFTRAM